DIIDSTAQFARTAEVHVEESEFLGWSPSCIDPDVTRRPRTFYVPEVGSPKFEPPIVEGPVFTDFSTGCGSNIGRGSRFSVWLTARDTRQPSEIVSAKFDGLEAALAPYAGLIAPGTAAGLARHRAAPRAGFT